MMAWGRACTVGVLSFGVERLLGTGSRARGPYQLQRLATEQMVITHTAAVDGHLILLTMD